MKEKKKAKKRTFEKRIIYTVFGAMLLVFLLVAVGFASRVVNVEKYNPVAVSSDFSHLTFDGSYFYSVEKAPENLTLVKAEWLGGARREGESRVDQAFRDRYTYAVYQDENGHRYIWVKDANFYDEGFEWADWSKDYPLFDQFENSYFYKER
ncbi:MAG: hypothetical protein E7515_04490 [Ruminococcaceae bacterium]|jgi:hypothetical protein|nr:hypothetical protein [Oscillospiraceae bacterium]